MAEPRHDELPDSSVEQAELDKLNLKLWEKVEEVPAEISEEEVYALVSSMFLSDFEAREQALTRLNRWGKIVTPHLVDILVKNPTDSTKAFQVTYALEIVGKNVIQPLLEALKKITDFRRSADITLLENITGVLIRLNDKSAVSILVQRLNFVKQNLQIGQNLNQNAKSANIQEPSAGNHQAQKKRELYQIARLRIHTLLGDMGVQEGLDDLLLLLGDGTKRVHEDIIETLSRIGDRRALVPLLRLCAIEQNISELGSRFIKLTLREIIRRDRVSKNDCVFKCLTKEEKDNIFKMFSRLG